MSVKPHPRYPIRCDNSRLNYSKLLQCMLVYFSFFSLSFSFALIFACSSDVGHEDPEKLTPQLSCCLLIYSLIYLFIFNEFD